MVGTEIKRLRNFIKNTVGMKFSLIPPGSFCIRLGDEFNIDTETGMQNMSVGKPFYLGCTFVTREQFWKVLKRVPTQRHQISGDDGNWPMLNVSWIDAVEFCNKLSHFDKPCKRFVRYRLPTELEWELAARSRESEVNVSDYGSEYDIDNIHEHQQFYSLSRPVAQYTPNEFGLYDMVGWVTQLCKDRYVCPELMPKVSDPNSGPSWLKSCKSSLNSIFQNQQAFRTMRNARNKEIIEDVSQGSIGKSIEGRDANSIPSAGAFRTVATTIDSNGSSIKKRRDMPLVFCCMDQIMYCIPSMVVFGAPRVTRGSYNIANRGWILPNLRSKNIGFRVAIEFES